MLTRFCLILLLGSPAVAVAEENLMPLFEAYDELQVALAGDDFKAAQNATGKLKTAFGKVEASKLTAALQPVWKAQSSQLTTALKQAASAGDINKLRTQFEPISMAMIAMAKEANPAGFQEYRCPMAFSNKGANWLQKRDMIANPYFGSAMLRCGFKVE